MICTQASKKDIGRIYKIMVEEQGLGGDVSTICSADYMRRFCSRLGLDNQGMKAATEMANVASPKVTRGVLGD